LPNLSHLAHDSAPKEAEVHLTLALVQLRHARLLTRRFIIDDGSGTSIVVTWDFVQRYGLAGVNRATEPWIIADEGIPDKGIPAYH
jgi:hypothetical protein